MAFFSSMNHSISAGASEPGAIEDGLFAPIGPDVERERALGRGEPVAGFVVARGGGPGVKRQRAVRVAQQGLVLGAERIAAEVVGVEEVLLVVEIHRPEAVDR